MKSCRRSGQYNRQQVGPFSAWPSLAKAKLFSIKRVLLLFSFSTPRHTFFLWRLNKLFSLFDIILTFSAAKFREWRSSFVSKLWEYYVRGEVSVFVNYVTFPTLRIITWKRFSRQIHTFLKEKVQKLTQLQTKLSQLVTFRCYVLIKWRKSSIWDVVFFFIPNQICNSFFRFSLNDNFRC